MSSDLLFLAAFITLSTSLLSTDISSPVLKQRFLASTSALRCHSAHRPRLHLFHERYPPLIRHFRILHCPVLHHYPLHHEFMHCLSKRWRSTRTYHTKHRIQSSNAQTHSICLLLRQKVSITLIMHTNMPLTIRKLCHHLEQVVVNHRPVHRPLEDHSNPRHLAVSVTLSANCTHTDLLSERAEGHPHTRSQCLAQEAQSARANAVSIVAADGAHFSSCTNIYTRHTYYDCLASKVESLVSSIDEGESEISSEDEQQVDCVPKKRGRTGSQSGQSAAKRQKVDATVTTWDESTEWPVEGIIGHVCLSMS